MQSLRTVKFYFLIQFIFLNFLYADNCIKNGVNTYGTNTNVAFGTNSDITTPSNFIPTTSITLGDPNNHQTCRVSSNPTDCNASGTLFSFTTFMKNQTIAPPTIDQNFTNLSAEATEVYNDSSTRKIKTNKDYNSLSVKIYTHITLKTEKNPLKIDNLLIDDVNSSLYITSDNNYSAEIKNADLKLSTFLTLENATTFKTSVFNQDQNSSIILPNIESIDAGEWNFLGSGACSQLEGTHGDYRFNTLGDNKNDSSIVINGADKVYAGTLAMNNIYLKVDTLAVATDFTLGENGQMSLQANTTDEVNVTVGGTFDIKNNSQVCLAAGDYYLNNLTLGTAVHIDPIGSGTVRIFVNGIYTDASSGKGAFFNQGGNPSKMLLYTKNDMTIRDAGAISGLVISDGTINIGATDASPSTIDGASISKNLNMVANAHITYDGYVNNIDSNSTNLTCNTPPNKTLTYSNSTRCQFVFTTTPSCPSPTNANGNSYSAPYGSFNIIDGTTNLTNNEDSTSFTSADNILYTQVIKKDFNVSLVHLNNDDLTTLDSAFDGYVTVDVADAEYISKEDSLSCANADQIIDLGLFYSFNGTISPHPHNMNNILINKVTKNATFRIKYIESASLPCVPTTPTTKIELEKCLSNNGLSDSNLSVVCARNNFAIRPKNFNIIKSDNNFTVKAGQNFNLTFQALDNLGANATDYNESVQNQGVAPSLAYNDENNITCLTGTVTLPSSSFVNGEVNITLSYDDVGDLNLTLQDTNGSEFALVDANDTSDALRFITPMSVTLHVLPHHFGINADYYNFNKGTFTYLSYDLNMSSVLDINITAQTEQNTTTKNYNRLCYAQTTNANISYLIDGVVSSKNLIYKEDNASEINATTISLANLNANYFTTDDNGTAKLSIKINSERNVSNSINPFVMSITNIDVTDVNNTQGSMTLDKNSTFIYGRTHAPRKRFVGTSGVDFVYYEAYCYGTDSFNVSCDKSFLPNGLNSTSTDDPRWFINSSHTSPSGNAGSVNQKGSASVVAESSGTLTGTPATANLTYDGTKYPYKATMENNASSWLIYNKYKENVTKNEFEVEFLNSGNWEGDHETNTTTDTNSSSITNRRIMW